MPELVEGKCEKCDRPYRLLKGKILSIKCLGCGNKIWIEKPKPVAPPKPVKKPKKRRKRKARRKKSKK